VAAPVRPNMLNMPKSASDPGIGNSTIPNPGIENSSPGLQSLIPIQKMQCSTKLYTISNHHSCALHSAMNMNHCRPIHY